MFFYIVYPLTLFYGYIVFFVCVLMGMPLNSTLIISIWSIIVVAAGIEEFVSFFLNSTFIQNCFYSFISTENSVYMFYRRINWKVNKFTSFLMFFWLFCSFVVLPIFIMGFFVTFYSLLWFPFIGLIFLQYWLFRPLFIGPGLLIEYDESGENNTIIVSPDFVKKVHEPKDFCWVTVYDGLWAFLHVIYARNLSNKIGILESITPFQEFARTNLKKPFKNS